MSEIITLDGNDLAPIASMLREMEEKGTLRSRHGTSRRECWSNWMAGMGAQIALKKLCEQRGIEVTVDTRAYDEVDADDGDLWEYRGDDSWHECEPVEVKKTVDYANHVAITDKEARLIGDDEPIVYAKTGWDGEINPDDPIESLVDLEVEYEVVGWCVKDDLHWVEQGAKPWTKQADNLCQPLADMRTDWGELFARIFPEASYTKSEGQFTFTDVANSTKP